MYRGRPAGGPILPGGNMRYFLMLPLLLVAACDRTDDNTGVSSEESARLNAAADLLDINATEPTPEAAPE
ncbi:MAG: hypothetical protein CVT77_15315 [Alphaproteobacteria bacterium HGW-Alphaproteobacteria-16]|nr:MAG: hypothetical protein CVT77_15315 [Alphaproteobacteria bacterium HGW-Alphaproteobacteria-16]